MMSKVQAAGAALVNSAAFWAAVRKQMEKKNGQMERDPIA